MSDSPKDLTQYRELLRRVEEKFEEIRALHPDQFACRLGCHSCCRPGLTVNALEAEALRIFFAAHPAAAAEARRLAALDPHKGKRCALLDENGACVAYEARPLVCRSHGAPLQFRPLEDGKKDAESQLRQRDVCPLNFTGLEIAQLPAGAVINLDTINTLLALLTRLAFPGDESRAPLRAEALLRE